MKRIRRRKFLKLSAGLSGGLATLSLARMTRAEGKTPSRPPNILVFLTDDHGQWAQRAYGNSELQTPNMDWLAAQGTRMTQAFTPCPVCSPARASFYTGRIPSQHGIHDWLEESHAAMTHPALKGQNLISELMKKAGYRTGLVGKWHCGREREPHPGFDYWFSYWLSQYPHKGSQRFSEQGRLVTEEGQQSPMLTRRAVDFIQEHRRKEGLNGRPFFLVVGYVDTHGPHKNAPEDLLQHYRSAKFNDIPREEFASCHGRALQLSSKNQDREREKCMEYYAAVSSVDREVGKVLEVLKASGQMENTLIVYTADHGLNCGQHGIWEKGNATIPQNFLEESIRVSCTLSWPAGNIRRNVVCDDMVDHCDLWATLLEIAQARPDASIATAINSPGLSYLRQLRGESVEGWRKTMFCEFGNARMARTETYKLIRRYPYAGVTFNDEIYDLRADPRETRNLHEEPSLKNVIRDLSNQMSLFFSKHTVAGRSGLALKDQPECNPYSPWLLAASSKNGR